MLLACMSYHGTRRFTDLGALDAKKSMAESYAKYLHRLEHSRHAEREATGPIMRTCRRHYLQREHRDAHVHHAGEDRASVATGGVTGKQASRLQ